MNFTTVSFRICCSEGLALLYLYQSWWLNLAHKSPLTNLLCDNNMYTHKFSASFCARFNNSALVFSSVITLRESLGNFWINHHIKIFLSSTVTVAILSTARIQTTLGICFAHNAAQLSSRASTCSSQVPGLSWPVSSSFKIQSHQ